MNTKYVYIISEHNPTLYTVGFYGPEAQWHSDSDHSTKDEASKRVNYLNGGGSSIETLQDVRKYFVEFEGIDVRKIVELLLKVDIAIAREKMVKS